MELFSQKLAKPKNYVRFVRFVIFCYNLKNISILTFLQKTYKKLTKKLQAVGTSFSNKIPYKVKAVCKKNVRRKPLKISNIPKPYISNAFLKFAGKKRQSFSGSSAEQGAKLCDFYKNTQKQSLAICIPLHQRFALIKELAPKWYQLAKNIMASSSNSIAEVSLIWTGTTTDEAASLNSLENSKRGPNVGTIFHIYPNAPLGQKWNYTVGLAKGHDFVLILGQDNLVNLEAINQLLARRVDLAGFYSAYIINHSTKETIYRTYGKFNGQVLNISGSGRLLSAKALEAINWTIFEPQKNSGLDIGLDQQIINSPLTWDGIYSKRNGPWHIGLKTNENLNPWHWFAHLPKEDYTIEY